MLGTGIGPDGQRVAKLTIERAGSAFGVVVHPLLLGDEQTRKIGITSAHEVIVDKIDPVLRLEAGACGPETGFRVSTEPR